MLERYLYTKSKLEISIISLKVFLNNVSELATIAAFVSPNLIII